jgi:hypothetical protein
MAARTRSIEWQGLRVHGAYEIISPSTKMAIEFVSAVQKPVQGLEIKAEGAILLVNGQAEKRIRLWHDTAPSKLTIEVKPKGRKPPALMLWNVWRENAGTHQITHAWLRNAGMLVHESSDRRAFRFECSDGVGEAEFSDLVFEVKLS